MCSLPWQLTHQLCCVFQSSKQKAKSSRHDERTGYLQYAVESVRRLIGQPDGFVTCTSLFMTAVVLSFFNPNVKLTAAPRVK